MVTLETSTATLGLWQEADCHSLLPTCRSFLLHTPLVRPTDTLSCCKSSVKKACLLIHSRGPQKNTPPQSWGLSHHYWKCTGSKQWLAEWATLSRSSLRTLRLATIARHLHPPTQKGKLRKFSFPCWYKPNPQAQHSFLPLLSETEGDSLTTHWLHQELPTRFDLEPSTNCHILETETWKINPLFFHVSA